MSSGGIRANKGKILNLVGKAKVHNYHFRYATNKIDIPNERFGSIKHIVF
jgi:hypothetical protein